MGLTYTIGTIFFSTLIGLLAQIIYLLHAQTPSELTAFAISFVSFYISAAWGSKQIKKRDLIKRNNE